MTAPILAAYGPEAADRGPVNFAIAASRFTGAPLIIAAVHHGGSSLDRLFSGEHGVAGREAVDRLRGELEEEGVSARFLVLEESTAPRGLAKAVDEVEPGLVVVGATRRAKAGRSLLGSTAERMVHGSPCPVAVVPHDHQAPPDGVRTVGAAFAPTPEGRDALRSAAVLARAGGARVRAVMVLDPSHAETQSPGLMASQHGDTDARENIAAVDRLGAADALREAIAELAPGVEAEPDILYQDPVEGIVAASRHLDLLVMGSRAYGPKRAVMLGGVSRRVTAAAACPVVVLPRGAQGLDPLLPRAQADVAG